MRRREFIAVLGTAVAGAIPTASAQQSSQPVIGVLSLRASDESASLIDAFRGGLKEAGFVQGRNVEIAFLWAEGHYERLPALAKDLVERRVAAIAAIGAESPAQAAKAATSTIPIVFVIGSDPVKDGLVASFNRPGGNVTGVTQFSGGLGAKRLELLRELVPDADVVAALVNPNSANTAQAIADVQDGARLIGRQVKIFPATNAREIDGAFAAIAAERIKALLIVSDPLFTSRRAQLALLSVRHTVATIYPFRDYVAAGGLISYGNSLTDAYRQCGMYVGRILNGAKPAELPVLQATKFELVINAQAAQVLGLAPSPALLARADEVID